jgi:hypothetical protein
MPYVAVSVEGHECHKPEARFRRRVGSPRMDWIVPIRDVDARAGSVALRQRQPGELLKDSELVVALDQGTQIWETKHYINHRQ